MIRERDRHQAMAMAGIIQAAYLVDQIARTGQAEPAAFNATLHSLFSFDPDSPEAVYGGLHNLQLGLGVLRDLLGSNRSERADFSNILRYTLGLLHLQSKLSRQSEMQAIIRSRLQHTEKKLEHFSNHINEIASSLSAIYQDTLSTFKFRIQVTGSYQQLQNPGNADRIRALLLAGVRSAFLWRQVGGNRWQLILGRNRLLRATEALLDA